MIPLSLNQLYSTEWAIDEYIKHKVTSSPAQRKDDSVFSESDLDLEAFKKEPLKPQLRKMHSNSNFGNEDGNGNTLDPCEAFSPVTSDGNLLKAVRLNLFPPLKASECSDGPDELFQSVQGEESQINQHIVFNLQELVQQKIEEPKKPSEPDASAVRQEIQLKSQPVKEGLSRIKKLQDEANFVPPEKKSHILTRTNSIRKTQRKSVRKNSSEEEFFTSQISQGVSSTSQSACQCSKTNCLKLYCQCFHNNRYCGENCNCNGCQNDGKHERERIEAVESIKSKGNRNCTNDNDVFDTSFVWGCKCKKTKCLKGYCECFIRNKKCTSHCKCEECDNRKILTPSNIKKKIKKAK